MGVGLVVLGHKLGNLTRSRIFLAKVNLRFLRVTGVGSRKSRGLDRGIDCLNLTRSNWLLFYRLFSQKRPILAV